MRSLILTTGTVRPPAPEGPGVVVTPNRRAAAALGVPFVSLDILARRQLREEGLLTAGELARQRALRRALNDVLAPTDLEGNLRRYAPTVRELLRAGLDDAPEPAALSPRARLAVEVARRYRDLLSEREQIEPAEALWAAAERTTKTERLTLTGYPRLGPGERRFLDAVAADGTLALLPHGDLETAERLGERGWRIERRSEVPSALGDRLALRFAGGHAPLVVGDEIEALRFADQESEVRHALAAVKRLLYRGVPHERIALIARDELLYGPLLDAVGHEYGVPVVASYALPLRETRYGAWLAAAAEVIRERAPFEATARLLAHPLCGGLGPDSWAAARRDHPSGFARWRELDPRIERLDWPEHATRAELLEHLFALLEDFGVPERLGAHGRDALAALRFGAAARTLAEPAAERVATARFLSELLELLSLLAVPVGTGRVGVALHSPLAVYGAAYDHVFVLGMAEGVTPAPVRDDPLLDFFERAALARTGLPLEGALEAAGREADSFAAMLRSARKQLVLSWPQSLAGRPRIASSYFGRLGLETGTPPARPPASAEEWRRHLLQDPAGEDAVADPVLAAARHAWRVERRRESEAPPDDHDGVIALGRDPERWTFSASQLVRLGQCPFKWFAERLLRLAEPEEADDEVSPLLRGQLWHRTLERALRGAVGSDDPRAAALDALDDAFAEAEEHYGVPALPTWSQRRLEHLQSLRRTLASDEFWPEGYAVEGLERSFETTWRGLRVAGIVDRVDDGPDGLRLVDYKTRASFPDGAKDASGRTRIDVQLPLYLEAAAPALFPGRPVVEASYFSLGAAEPLRRARPDPAALDELAERVRRHLREGRYPVDPDLHGNACTSCEFDLLCRRGPRLERKRLAGGES